MKKKNEEGKQKNTGNCAILIRTGVPRVRGEKITMCHKGNSYGRTF